MPDLGYFNAPNAAKGAPSFPYIYESGANRTGWRPYSTADLVSLNVDSINVSGLSVTVSGIKELQDEQERTNVILENISGQLAILNTPYIMIQSTGLVQSFNAYTGRCLVSKINGFSLTPYSVSYIQIFSENAASGLPVANLLVESGNNFFYTFEGGVLFDDGITVASSRQPFNQVSGLADFFVTVFYKPFP